MDFRKIIMLAVVALVVIVAIKMARQEPAVDATTGETAVEGAATTTEPAVEGEAAPAAQTTPATDGAAAPDAVTPATKDTGEASGTEVPAESADEAAPAPAEAH